MKVYIKVVIDIRTLKEVEEIYKEYEGSVSLCGGSSGGAVGKVEFPAYLSNIQQKWMIPQDYDTMGYLGITATTAMNNALGNSPFMGEVAYDPSTRITNMETEVGSFETLVDALAETTDWAALFAQAVTTAGTAFVSTTPSTTTPSTTSPSGSTSNWLDPSPAASAEITADVDAFEAIVDDHVESDVLPRFQRGMQNINAVMSSAFTIGQAVIEGMADRDVAKYQGDLRTKAYLLKDQLVAQSKLRESERIVDLGMQVDEIASREDIQANEIASREDMQDNEIAHREAMDKNKIYAISVEQMVRYYMTRVQAASRLAGLEVQSQGLALQAERDEAESQLGIDEADGRWDLETYQYGANLMAAVSGAGLNPAAPKGMTKTQSTISGAASGAATGTMIGGGVGPGTAIGAVVGAYMGYQQSG